MILITIIEKVFLVFKLMLLARIVGSWIPELQSSKFMQFVSFYTDPYLNLFRRLIPPLGMIDFSPIIAFLALGFIEYFITMLIVSLIR